MTILRAKTLGAVFLASCLALTPTCCLGDTFLFVDQDGSDVSLEANLVGSSPETYVLETSDGEYRLVPRGAAKRRIPSEGPEPLTCEAVAEQLKQEFTDELFRSYVQEPFTIGLVLGSPLSRTAEGQAKAFMRTVATFMKNVESAFGRYLRDARIETPPALAARCGADLRSQG